VLMALSFLMSLGGLAAFFWANSNDQFDDLTRPAEEMLCETDESIRNI
jgi:cbb3-type cytochrome oxidase maturation protein